MIVGSGGSSSSTELGGEPSDNVVMEVCLGDFEKELFMGDAVKGFVEVNGQICGPCRRFQSIETFCRQWQESSCCRVEGFECWVECVGRDATRNVRRSLLGTFAAGQSRDTGQL